jgi:Tat protein secretion system quality control protein TatD with DNase activity
VKYICAKIAEIKGIDYQSVEAQTTANAKRIFNI